MMAAARFLTLLPCLLLAACCETPGQRIAEDLSQTAGEGPPKLSTCLRTISENGEAISDAQARAIVAGEDDKTPEKSIFNKFLDCVAGDVDPQNLRLRLLRGHMIVAVLATYGAYNVGFGTDPDKQTHAATLLARIEVAEETLRRASEDVTGKANAGDAYHPTVDTLTRSTAVFDVALAAERPTLSRLKVFATNIASVVAGGAGSIPDLVRTALGAIRKAATIDLWGNAYRIDMRAFLDRFKPKDKGGQGETLTKQHWLMWDQDINRACDILQAVAGVKQHCIPAEFR